MSAQQADVSRRGDAPESVSTREPGEGSSTDDFGGAPLDTDLSLDVVFEILKNERRRSVLEYLQTDADRVMLGELAEFIAARENDTTVESLTAQQRKRVYVGLYQCHLPKMDDADVVAFDRNRGVVELGPNAEGLIEYLESDAEQEHDWQQYYLGLALGGGFLFLVGQAGLFPAGWMADVVILSVIAAFGAVAFAHDRATVEE